MDNSSFYNIIDSRIGELAEIHKDNSFLKKVNNEKSIKSFFFLYWFLERYLPEHNIEEIENFITEGNDDASCDLIFDNKDQDNKDVFYVVQAKWFVEKNINKTNEITKEIKACIADFNLIKTGRKKLTVNDSFNKQYQKLLEHKKRNGKIKFIFLALCSGKVDIEEHKEGFVSNLISFDLIDFQVLKEQYIEIEYKGIKTHNPLETPYLPAQEFDLEFEQEKFVTLSSPYRSYIFIIRPKMIYLLFEKYAHSLFYKNIRNPLVKSLFNEEIRNTVINNPKSFWYFNNGITAITDNINDFYPESGLVTIKGIQIINGAQTVYSIYQAYKNASDDIKNKMDNDARITMRVVTTGGKDFDFKVTRYTNSQNPVNQRDFHSNDDIQIRLQKDFLKNTNVWYEKRRGEFRRKPKNVLKLTNESLGQNYLAYFLNDPFNAKQSKKMIFVEESINKKGLYNKVFNENTNHEDMLVSYYLYNFIETERKKINKEIKSINIDEIKTEELDLPHFNFVQYASFDILSLYKILFYNLNFGKEKAINGKLIYLFKKGDLDKISKCYELIKQFIKIDLENRKALNPNIVNSVLFKQKEYYPELQVNFQSELQTNPQYYKSASL